MGGGDIKMMAMVGSFVGWKGVLLTVFLGALLGSLIFVPLSLKKKRLVPLGVFLALGAAVTFVMGDAIIAWYQHFLHGAGPMGGAFEGMVDPRNILERSGGGLHAGPRRGHSVTERDRM